MTDQSVCVGGKSAVLDSKGHETRSSDSHLYDEVCANCGGTDAFGDERLDKPCPTTCGPQNPWEQAPHVWKTESQFWAYVRGCIREGWARHPVKLEFVKQHRIRVPNPNPRGRGPSWGMECARCKGEFILPLTKKQVKNIEDQTGEPLDYNPIEINHKTEAGTLSCKEDLGRFSSNLLFVTFDDLEGLCRLCHGIITYAQRYGVTEEEAEIEKAVIQAFKDYSNQEIKDMLIGAYIEPASNAAKRRAQVRELFTRRKDLWQDQK